MPPPTPLHHLARAPSTPHQPSSAMIPSSHHSSGRSMTPDSVYSDVTHPAETPRRSLWTPRRTSPEEALGDTPRRYRTDRRSRIKPTFQQGVAAYPLTFASTNDTYTYGDPMQVTALLDREHGRISALPQAIYDGLNAKAYSLDRAAQRRITYLTEKIKSFVTQDGTHRGLMLFPLEGEDTFVRELKSRTSRLAERLERDARGFDRRRRREPVTRTVESIRKFTLEEQQVYEGIVQCKGRLPLHMGEYDAWAEEWEVAKEQERMARTALGRGKRKRSELVVDMPVVERSNAVVLEQKVAPTTLSAGDMPVTKKRRTATTMRERAQYTTTPSSAGSGASLRVMQSSSAFVETSLCGLVGERKKADGKRRGLGFTVSKSSMTSSCSSPDAGDGKAKWKAREEPEEQVEVEGYDRTGVVATAVQSETLLMGQNAIEQRTAVQVGVMARQDDTVDAATFGPECGAGAHRKQQANIARHKSPPSTSKPATIAGPPEETTFGPEWHANVRSLRMVTIASRTNAPPEPRAEISEEEKMEMEGMLTGAAGEDRSFDRYDEQGPFRSGSKDFANVRADVMARDVDENAEKSPLSKIATEVAAEEDNVINGGVAEKIPLLNDSTEISVEEEQESGGTGEKFPSLSFPEELSTSTPNASKPAHPAGDETIIMHSSPGRPFWESESLPLKEPVTRRHDETLPATQEHDDPPNLRPRGNGSMSDLMGMMDDLTSSRRRACAETAAEGKRSVWNVTSSPRGDEACGAGFSQGIRRMGQGMMEETADLLGTELVD